MLDVSSSSAWKPLKHGDSIYIIAPSTRPNTEEIDEAAAMFRRMGLNPIIAAGINEGYFDWGNTAQHRADQIITALNTQGVRAIFTMGGGEGASEVVEELHRRKDELAHVKNRGVPLIGGSDITFLHHYLGEQGVVSPVQGPAMGYLTTIISDERQQHSAAEQIDARINAARHNQELMEHFLMHDHSFEQLTLTPVSNAARRQCAIEGTLVGGNDQITPLARFTTHGPEMPLHAAASQPILFLEGFTLSGLRNTLTQLRDCGDLSRYRAIVLGKYYEHGNRQQGQDVPMHAIQQILSGLGINNTMAVFEGVPFGHPTGMFEQRPLPLYTTTTIQTDGNAATMTISRFRTQESLHPRPPAQFPGGNNPLIVQPASGTHIIDTGSSESWMQKIYQLHTQETAGRDIVLHFNFNEQVGDNPAQAINPLHSFLMPLIAGGRLRDAASLTISTNYPLSPEVNRWVGEFATRQLPNVPVHVTQQEMISPPPPGDTTLTKAIDAILKKARQPNLAYSRPDSTPGY